MTNVQAPVLLDVVAAEWLADAADAAAGDGTAKADLSKLNRLKFDLIFCANMLHISPWATCAALMQGSARHLAAGERQLIDRARSFVTKVMH